MNGSYDEMQFIQVLRGQGFTSHSEGDLVETYLQAHLTVRQLAYENRIKIMGSSIYVLPKIPSTDPPG